MGSTVNTYRYDLTDQLTNGAGSFTYSATYDAVGNRQTADGRTYTPNSVNQYTQLTSPSQSLNYDANGNLTNWAGASFAHDSQGQLTSSSALTGDWKMYDYRRLRVDDGWDDPYAENYHYAYDARGNLLERSLDYEYSVEYAYADGLDQVVLMLHDDFYGQQPYALVTDHLGSVIAIFDDSGHLIETYDYTPFGKTTIKNSSAITISSSTVGNILGFTGREMDGDYYYYRNRWYSPDLGRFLEPDPIGLDSEDVNIYRYVGNNVLYGADPSGTELTTVTLVTLLVASIIYKAGKFAIGLNALNSRAQAAFAYMNAVQWANAYYGGNIPASVQCHLDQWQADLVTQFGQGIMSFIQGTPGTSFKGPVWNPRSSAPGTPPPTSPPIYRNPRTPVTPLGYPTREQNVPGIP